MTPPLLDVEGDEHGNTSLMTSASTMESVFKNPGLTERNYLGLSDSSSVDSSAVSAISEMKTNNLNLKATELRLGLPGSQSPGRDADADLASSPCLDEKPLFPLIPSSTSQKIIVSGNKRGFSDTIGEGSWMFGSSAIDSDSSKSLANGKILSGNQAAMIKDVTSKVNGSNASVNKVNTSNPPAAK